VKTTNVARSFIINGASSTVRRVFPITSNTNILNTKLSEFSVQAIKGPSNREHLEQHIEVFIGPKERDEVS
jgi:hypothetical protein